MVILDLGEKLDSPSEIKKGYFYVQATKQAELILMPYNNDYTIYCFGNFFSKEKRAVKMRRKDPMMVTWEVEDINWDDEFKYGPVFYTKENSYIRRNLIRSIFQDDIGFIDELWKKMI